MVFQNFLRKNFNSDFLIKQLDKSLNDLETDYLDLIQLHNPEEQILRNLDFIQSFIEEKKKENKSLWIVFKKPSDFFYVKNLDLIDSIQVNLNILDTRVIELGIVKNVKKIILLFFLVRHLVLVFNRKINADHCFKNNDHRSLWSNDQKKRWVGYSKKLFENNLLSKKTSQAQFCLSFCMSLPEVSVTIAGMTNEKEVLENSNVLCMRPMSKTQIKQIIRFNKHNHQEQLLH